MTTVRHVTLVVVLASIASACGRDCPGAYIATASITGTLTVENSEGVTTFAVGEGETCQAHFSSMRSERGPESGHLAPLTVHCAGYSYYSALLPSDGAVASGAAADHDLTTASDGEERTLAATPSDIILTIQRAIGELQAYPAGPTEDYVREFTVTATFECDETMFPCDTRGQTLELTGVQLPEHFQEQCSVTLDE